MSLSGTDRARLGETLLRFLLDDGNFARPEDRSLRLDGEVRIDEATARLVAELRGSGKEPDATTTDACAYPSSPCCLHYNEAAVKMAEAMREASQAWAAIELERRSWSQTYGKR